MHSLRLFNLQSSKARNTSSQPRDRIKDGLEGEQWVDVLLDAKQCVDIVVDMQSAHTCDYCRLHGDARNERTMLQLDIETLKDRARRLPGVPETALAKFMRAMNSMAYGASGVGSLYDVVDDVCSHVLTPSLVTVPLLSQLLVVERELDLVIAERKALEKDVAAMARRADLVAGMILRLF